MELMSSLLLCALVAMVRQALAQSLDKIDVTRKFNSTIYLGEKPLTHKKVLLNINGPPLLNMINEIEIVFSDKACHLCIDCMERAIKAYKTNHYLTENRRSTKKLQNSFLNNYYLVDNYREKRNADNETKSVNVEENNSKLKTKNKVYTYMTVTKYNIDGEVYALKVEGIDNHNSFNEEKSTKIASSDCQIYNVKNTFDCDSPEGEAIIVNVKRNIKKERRSEKIRKEKKIKYVIGTTSKITAMYRKRQIDNSQVPEHVMPSIEELIY